MTRSSRSLALAVALLAAPAALGAQQAPAAQAPSAPPQVQGLITEIQQIHERLQAIQERALADASLASAQESLGATIKAAMNQADPELEASMERVKALETEFLAAQQANDTTKQQTISAEAGKIQERFLAAQQKVVGQAEIVAKMEAFQAQLEAKMVALDPGAKQLISRFRELESQLNAVAAGR